MTTTAYQHITIDDCGIPWIGGTQTKVVEVALDWLAHSWDASEIHRQHAHLSMGQIHSALAYYFDHREELDRDIEDRIQREESFFQKQPESTIRQKVRAKGAQ
jgi:uncharacterized protein (DUF433 family)